MKNRVSTKWAPCFIDNVLNLLSSARSQVVIIYAPAVLLNFPIEPAEFIIETDTDTAGVYINVMGLPEIICIVIKIQVFVFSERHVGT